MVSRIGDVEAPGILIGRLESVHVMRGIAASSVMMCHLTYANENFRAKLPSFSSLFSYGHLGVWMFFVISGFVIPFAMKGLGYRFPASAWPFFLRRIVRLEPPYIISVFLAFALAYVAARTPGYRGAPFSLDLQTFLVQFVYLAPWFHRPWINVVAWTLAIEFQYYILMLFIGPLLVSGSRYKLVLLFAFVVASSLLIKDERAVFRYLPCFGLGFASLLYYEKRLNFVSFCGLIVALGVLTSYNVNIAAAVVAVGSVALIFLPIRKPVPILSFLGTISYSLYLVHPLIGGKLVNLTTRLPAIGWLQLLGLVGAVAASLGTAYALWWLVEKPSTWLSRTVSETGAVA
jgi:peptidoglycan/LPS O-acetylase OafA/YrhL